MLKNRFETVTTISLKLFTDLNVSWQDGVELQKQGLV